MGIWQYTPIPFKLLGGKKQIIKFTMLVLNEVPPTQGQFLAPFLETLASLFEWNPSKANGRPWTIPCYLDRPSSELSNHSVNFGTDLASHENWGGFFDTWFQQPNNSISMGWKHFQIMKIRGWSFSHLPLRDDANGPLIEQNIFDATRSTKHTAPRPNKELVFFVHLCSITMDTATN